ncbi:hypothetical protein M409DRAFT_59901 [Zasmidium cellare ATCC 36951]|uniref:Uncharacterized protein n=1 Tax=Zasmidium cellare ATCC 36951 TaxID=1080233 RepID=A0A6A6C4V6_ZASCE|nr:uncharacterized protein M409DRAFT_59901 [Zasmidium cellare ATCC 36951]KAF2160416.1 hypothetical protein M409DRAFT_59901 [Zasmidium cellare ATCC 36951]
MSSGGSIEEPKRSLVHGLDVGCGVRAVWVWSSVIIDAMGFNLLRCGTALFPVLPPYHHLLHPILPQQWAARASVSPSPPAARSVPDPGRLPLSWIITALSSPGSTHACPRRLSSTSLLHLSAPLCPHFLSHAPAPPPALHHHAPFGIEDGSLTHPPVRT